MDPSLSIVIVLAIAAVALVALLLTYNHLVRLRNKVQNAWSDIDVTLKRRHDLIPNLVEAARSYMAHERGSLEAVTSARTQAIASAGDIATIAAAEATLSGALGNLMMTSERYPKLHASENMKLLQEQLTSTENRIALARQCYNDFVMQYNTAIASFPRNLVAGALGFSPAMLFQASAADRPSQQIAMSGVNTPRT